MDIFFGCIIEPAPDKKNWFGILFKKFFFSLVSSVCFFAFCFPLVAGDLLIEVKLQGTGETANGGMNVSVHYQGRLADGTIFDDSRSRDEPFDFVLGNGQVIKGWEKGIKGMRVGERRALTIPPDLGYGVEGFGDIIPPNATLYFDVELLAVSLPPNLKLATSEDLKIALKNDVTIIDIRREEEWKSTGIIEGADTITAFTKSGQLRRDFLNKFRSLVKKPDEKFLIYCRTGNRTGVLGRALATQLGYKQVAHLTNGIVGWRADGENLVPYTR